MGFHKTELQGIYTLFEPTGERLPLLIDSPHSGRLYPPDFQYTCDFSALMGCEDNYLDVVLNGSLTSNTGRHPELVSGSSGIHEDPGLRRNDDKNLHLNLQTTIPNGATYLQCDFPRSYIDVNRAHDDIDPALFRTLPQEPINPTGRSTAGYGLIRRLIKPGLPVYNNSLTLDDLNSRLRDYYLPYHKALQDQIDILDYNYGYVFYLNMHSMPDSSAHTEDGHPVDFVLGDRHGTTCRRDFIWEVKGFLEDLGYRVSLNDPYKGVELVRRHGQPHRGKNALQIEINKKLYWDEKTGKLLTSVSLLQENISTLFDFCSRFIAKESMPKAAD